MTGRHRWAGHRRRVAMLGVALVVAACDRGSGPARPATTTTSMAGPTTTAPVALVGYADPVLLAELEDPEIVESSGLAASRRASDRFWTHNDSGDGPRVFCFGRDGRSCGTWTVTGADARDWEDLAVGPGPEPGRSYLYLGDIGDNDRVRAEIVVYRVEEPPPGPATTRSTPPPAAEALRLTYPDGAHDAEALAVHPLTGDLYLITKEVGPARVYKAAAPLDPARPVVLAPVAVLPLPGLVTGGDISPDGTRVALATYADGYEMTLPAGAAGFDEVWRQPVALIALGDRRQGESLAYRPDGGALLTTSEGRPAPLQEMVRVGRGG